MSVEAMTVMQLDVVVDATMVHYSNPAIGRHKAIEEPVQVTVELPECVRVPGTKHAVTFLHHELPCRLCKRTWYWYLQIARGEPVQLRKGYNVPLNVALWAAIQLIELRYYNDGRVRPMNEGWVYFVRSELGGPIKIGYASCVDARIAGLQTGRPDRLVCLGAIRGTKEVERALHDALACFHVRGEWFRDDYFVIEFLDALVGADECCTDPMALIGYWFDDVDSNEADPGATLDGVS